MKILIEPQRVISLAYAHGEYLPANSISQSDIITAQSRYILPVVGDALSQRLTDGDYPSLMSEYIAPALAEYVRYVANVEQYPADRTTLKKAQELLLRLSDHLESNAESYPEYNPTCNVLKRCSINGGFVQIH